jgi:hypothetical protein
LSTGNRSKRSRAAVSTGEPIDTEQPEIEPIHRQRTTRPRQAKRTAAGRGCSRHERPAAVAAPRKTAAKNGRVDRRAKKQTATDRAES